MIELLRCALRGFVGRLRSDHLDQAIEDAAVEPRSPEHVPQLSERPGGEGRAAIDRGAQLGGPFEERDEAAQRLLVAKGARASI